jgi:hypothetical protein
MTSPVGNAIVGLPALLGVVLGLKLYVDPIPTAYYVATMMMAAFAARWIAFATIHRVPRVARWLIELWILAAIGVTAVATAGVTWVTLNATLGFLFDTSHIDVKQLEKMTTAIVTALTTYVALVWTKDIGDAKGFFWPSTAFKTAMAKAYSMLTAKPVGTTKEYEAMFMDTVTNHGNIGWGFGARGIRAKILADSI